MSDTDIYKNREAMPLGGSKMPKKKRRRRQSTQRAFDEIPERKRRKKNSGFRRLRHLFRKSDNEKYFWGITGTIIVVLLIILALWQFVIVEYMVRTQEKTDDYMEYQPNIPDHTASPAE